MAVIDGVFCPRRRPTCDKQTQDDASTVKLNTRLQDEAGSTSWLDEPTIWSFEWCNIANIHEAARRTLVVRSSSQLVEPASSCKRGITGVRLWAVMTLETVVRNRRTT